MPLDKALLNEFQIEGKLLEVTALKRGHINETYQSSWLGAGGIKRYVHQLVNKIVFPDVPLLMRNVEIVTAHVREKLTKGEGIQDETVLNLIPTKSGESFIISPDGQYWRTYDFVEDTTSVDFCTDPDQAFRAAKAFGRFERYLKDLDPKKLGEPIPRFQSSDFRYEQLRAALQADTVKRLQHCSSEIDFALRSESLVKLFASARDSGKIPLRATHADMKVNNVLLSNKSGEGICIVDLDTCMPGSVLYDFGDLCRTTTVRAAEDEQDFSLVVFNRELFEAVARGFLTEFGKGLVADEIKLLHLAPQLISLTIGVRFLTDFLNGDKYFRIHRENHNLERARTQFQVVRTMQSDIDKMEQLVKLCVG